MDIVLIRHPAVAVDAGVCYGRSDVALAEDAGISSNALALKLATLQVPAPRVLLSSPLTRCSALAAGMANDFGCVLSH
ncbi:MAG TPA: histidine phosphatase family protein, partial [Paraburkholderia sp.]